MADLYPGYEALPPIHRISPPEFYWCLLPSDDASKVSESMIFNGRFQEDS